MTKITNVFEFIIPLTKKEYNIGNIYAIIHTYKIDKTKGFKITLLKKENTHHDTMGNVESTTKHIHLHSKIPSLIRKCIPDAACILTEVSHYNDSLIHTTYKNNHFPNDVFNLQVETHLSDKNPFEGFEVETIDLSNNKEFIKCYKKIDIEINNWMMGWIAYEISNDMRKQIIEHHEKIVETKDEWIKTDSKELSKIEDTIFKN